MVEMSEMNKQRVQSRQLLTRLMYTWGYDKAMWPEDFEGMFWKLLESYPELKATLTRFYDAGKEHAERRLNREL